jgi:hypothetical protein
VRVRDRPRRPPAVRHTPRTLTLPSPTRRRCAGEGGVPLLTCRLGCGRQPALGYATRGSSRRATKPRDSLAPRALGSSSQAPPGNAWPRGSAASPRAAPRHACGQADARQSLADVRSQAEPGNEQVHLLTCRLGCGPAPALGVHDNIVGARNPRPPGAVDQQLVSLPQALRVPTLTGLLLFHRQVLQLFRSSDRVRALKGRRALSLGQRETPI